MSINIACFQMDVEWGREKVNIKKAFKALDKLEKGRVQIACFPELFTTGFDYAYLREREMGLTGQILEGLSIKAREKDIYILAGTLPEMEKGNFYNTIFVIDPNGRLIGSYRKMHLFPLIEEDKFFSPGNKGLIFSTPFAKIGVAVCYDLRFPHLFQQMTLKGAYLVFVPAQFPSARIEHWDTLLKARAIENQIFMIGVNRTGKDPFCKFSGHTAIFNPMGELIAGGGEDEGWVIYPIDLKEVDRVRVELPAFYYSIKK